jgi:DNA-binding NarL/FixJ family response regulator
MIRILITDDHSIVRKGIRQIIVEAYPESLIEEAYDAESMLEKVKEKEWDIVISDLSMPGKNGIEVIPQIISLRPQMPVLIMSIHPVEHYALRVLKLGAAGYLNKDSATEELIEAIRTVISGEKYMTPFLQEKLSAKKNKELEKPLPEMLSDREFEVFKLLAVGKSISEIAEKMNLSVTTVSTYRARLLSKTNFTTNAEITLYCLNNNIIEKI